MATIQVSGGDFINGIASDVQNDSTLYLRSYLSFGSMASESWNTQSFDDSASSNSASWKSSQGSAVSYKYKSTGTDTAGAEGGSLSVFGKSDGVKISATWSNDWSAISQNE